MSFWKKKTSPPESAQSNVPNEETVDLTPEQLASMDDEQIEEAVSKKKKKAKRRSFTSGPLRYVTLTCMLLMAAYHLYAAIFSVTPQLHRYVHLIFILVLVFIFYPARKNSPRNRPSAVDWVLVAVSLVSGIMMLFRFLELAQTAARYTTTDIVLGSVLILLIYEAARRTVGNALPIIATVMLLFGFFGRYVPGPLRHAGFSITRIVSHLTLTTEGIFGTLLGTSSTYIYMFVLFGAFLSVTGMSQLFNDLALAIAGSRRGGPAKVSILASGLMGTISGSPSSNVVTTGAFTIPLMKKTGYPDYFASGVEAVASTGGSIMPPVMGAASFVMADMLGVPYATILRTAILPAILYYLSVWVMVDLRARKLNLKTLPKGDLPPVGTILKERGHLAIPLVAIIVMLSIGYNAMDAAIIGILVSIAASFLRKSTRIKPKELIKAIELGSLGILSVATACAIIGIVVGIFTLTGSILTFGRAILALSGGLLVPTLLLTMVTALIMGMGMPTTAVYILTSTVAAPVIVKLGYPALMAHFFVFYYGILAPITPPVATASYAAAGLSGAGVGKTGWSGLKLATAGFIIPFMFMFSPELLLPAGTHWLKILQVAVTSCIGVFSLGMAIEGFMYRKLHILERLACAAAAILLIDSTTLTDVIGCALIAAVMVIQYLYRKKNSPANLQLSA